MTELKRAGKKRVTSPALLEPVRTEPSEFALELAKIRNTAYKEDIPFAHAAVLVYAATHRPDLAPYLRDEPQIVLGDLPIYVFIFGDMLQKYNNPNVFHYISVEGKRNWPDTKSLKREKQRTMMVMREHYASRAPAADTFAQFSNYAGGVSAHLAILENNNGRLPHSFLQIPQLAATAAMELVAAVKPGFEPHVLPLFPNPLNGNSLTMNDFIYSGK